MMSFGLGGYSCSGYWVSSFGFLCRKGTLVLNFHIPDFYGRWLVGINLHCVIPQESKLLYESF
jgi:hypothetical protein